MKNKKHIYSSNRLSFKFKCRYFVTFAESIFLYNCELWTLTKTLENKLDAFHRRQLRYAMGIIYPRKISSKKLYRLTNQEPWSRKIKRRRLSFFGHLCRLPEGTCARKSLAEAIKPIKYKRGKPKTTWLKRVQDDLNTVLINKLDLKKHPTDFHQRILQIAADREQYKTLIGGVMSRSS
jgi:hypothetical protein